MTTSRLLAIVLVILGIICAAVAIIYLAEPARSIPSFLPGRIVRDRHHHTVRGYVALAVAVVLLAAGVIAALIDRREAY